MDVHLKLEFPSILGVHLLDPFDYLNANFSQTEVTFRFKCNIPFVRSGDFSWIPVFSFARKTKPVFWNSEQIQQSVAQTVNLKLPGCSSINDAQYFYPSHDVQSKILHEAQWIKDSCLSIKKGNTKLCDSGVGGTYFVFEDETNYDKEPKIVSVFKPIDEEPGAPNNPKKNSTFVPLMTWGAGAHREVAAFKLDKGFIGVPETLLVEVVTKEGTKKGSLQKFVSNDGDCSDVGASKFSVDDVHKIGIFDVRILNMDRNDENLLIIKSDQDNWKLIPIDHTYAFPNKINSYFNWQFWHQTKKPFTNETLAYIQQINVIDDALMLLECGIDEESVKNGIGATLLLQKAANKGLNLFQIASMVSGQENDLVKILSKVKEKEEHQGDRTEDRFHLFKAHTEEMIEDFLKNKY